jgi:hypothetical protein
MLIIPPMLHTSTSIAWGWYDRPNSDRRTKWTQISHQHRNTSVIILDIIDHFVFYFKHDISVTGFCIRLDVEPTQLDPIDRASLSPDKSKSKLFYD